SSEGTPFSTSYMAGESVRLSSTTSAAATASAGEPANAAPSATRPSARDRVRPHTVTGCPAASSTLPIARPIGPSPIRVTARFALPSLIGILVSVSMSASLSTPPSGPPLRLPYASATAPPPVPAGKGRAAPGTRPAAPRRSGALRERARRGRAAQDPWRQREAGTAAGPARHAPGAAARTRSPPAASLRRIAGAASDPLRGRAAGTSPAPVRAERGPVNPTGPVPVHAGEGGAARGRAGARVGGSAAGSRPGRGRTRRPGPPAGGAGTAGRPRGPGAATFGGVRFGILGPLEVRDAGGAPVPVPGARVRALLAVLLLARGRAVSVDRLVE